MKWAIAAIIGLLALQMWYPEILPIGLRGHVDMASAAREVATTSEQTDSQDVANGQDMASATEASGTENPESEQPANPDESSQEPSFELVQPDDTGALPDNYPTDDTSQSEDPAVDDDGNPLQ